MPLDFGRNSVILFISLVRAGRKLPRRISLSGGCQAVRTDDNCSRLFGLRARRAWQGKGLRKQKKSSLRIVRHGTGTFGVQRPLHKLWTDNPRVVGVSQRYGAGQPSAGSVRHRKTLNCWIIVG